MFERDIANVAVQHNAGAHHFPSHRRDIAYCLKLRQLPRDIAYVAMCFIPLPFSGNNAVRMENVEIYTLYPWKTVSVW